MSVADSLSFRRDRREARLDLRVKAVRVLVESTGIVLARNEGKQSVLNLDPTFDRALGGR